MKRSEKLAAQAAFKQRPKGNYTSVRLPWPISVNALTFNTKKSRGNTPRYEAWIKEAGAVLESQRPKAVSGLYDAYMRMSRKDNRKRDLSNHYKCVSDLLVKHGVIEDDSLEQSITLEWDSGVDQCFVEITKVKP